MSWALLLPLLGLLSSLGAGLVRVMLGPTDTDRMLAAQLIGTTGAAILLLLSWAAQLPALLDVAIVYGLLAVVTAVAFAGRPPPAEAGP